MKTFTIEDVRRLKPCYDPEKYLGESWTGRVVDILDIEECPAVDRIWVAVRLMDRFDVEVFAIDCAFRAYAGAAAAYAAAAATYTAHTAAAAAYTAYTAYAVAAAYTAYTAAAAAAYTAYTAYAAAAAAGAAAGAGERENQIYVLKYLLEGN